MGFDDENFSEPPDKEEYEKWQRQQFPLAAENEKLQKELDAALLQIHDLRRLLGPYSTVEIALKKYQECADEATERELENNKLLRLISEMQPIVDAARAFFQRFPLCLGGEMGEEGAIMKAALKR